MGKSKVIWMLDRGWMSIIISSEATGKRLNEISFWLGAVWGIYVIVVVWGKILHPYKQSISNFIPTDQNKI